MTAKKRGAKPKALPADWNLEQLTEELRVALGLTNAPSVVRQGTGIPQALMRSVPKAQGRGANKRTVMEDLPWTDAQLATIKATIENHVADPKWHQKGDDALIDRILTEPTFDAFLGAAAGSATPAQRDNVIKDLIRATRALARIARGQAQ